MTATGASTVRCSDPFKEGCVRTVTPGFNLPKSPHRQAKVACQKCKYRIRMRERERQGLPPARNGAHTRDRL